MLSRLILRGSSNLRKSTLQFHPTFSTSAIVASDKTGLPPGIPREYPNPTSKRDYINYPKLHLRETAPPVRFLCIPESFFTFMYPKTGYTGFHTFFFTTAIYFGSQETFSCVDEFRVYVSELILLTFVYFKYGDKLAAIYNKYIQENEEELNGYQESKKENCRMAIEDIKESMQTIPAVDELVKANSDIVHLQLENAFRDRIVAVHKQVKSKLDCYIQLEGTRNVILLKYLKDFIMNNVMSSITPELEKSVLQKSISDLNSLAAKA